MKSHRILLSAALALACAGTLSSSHAALAELNVVEGSIRTDDGSFSGRDFVLARDFKLELLYVLPANQGSWLPLDWDEKGRLLVASHNSDNAARVTIPSVGSNAPVRVEPIAVKGVGYAHGLVYTGNAFYIDNSESPDLRAGIYKVSDTNGDDRYDQVRVVRNATIGGSQHGDHALILSPDKKKIFMTVGNNVAPPVFQSSLVPRVWSEDNLTPRLLVTGPGMQAAPQGFIATMDFDGNNLELFGIGRRNMVGIAFNADNELFGYDSDMEFDMGSPWYRPTNIQHIIPGSDVGWRDGSRKHPMYFFDNFGVIATVGSGSPTGVNFGTGAKMPARYQTAMYASDWSYGNLWTVFITPDGASYRGDVQPFASGRPFSVTGVTVNKADGSLIVFTGGNSQTQLYRVTYTGKESTAAAVPDSRASAAREIRRGLEKFYGHKDPAAIEAAWRYLDDPDRAIRFAARTALEWQDKAAWQARALDEANPRRSIAALASLARVSGKDIYHTLPGSPAPDKVLQGRMLASLDRIDVSQLPYQDTLDLMRAYELALIRLGPPDEATRQRLIAKFDPMLPATHRELNWQVAEMLVYLEAPSAATKLMALLRTAPSAPYYSVREYPNPLLRTRNNPALTGPAGASNAFLAKQEDQIQYAELLRGLKAGWTPELRKEYLDWFQFAAGNYSGGNQFANALQHIRADAVSQIPADSLAGLQAVIDTPMDFSRGAVAAAGGGAAGGGRGGAAVGTPGLALPAADPYQLINSRVLSFALTDLDFTVITKFDEQMDAQRSAVQSARADLQAATFATVPNPAGVTAKVNALRDADLALALARADAWTKLQAEKKYSPEKVTAIKRTMAATVLGGGPGGVSF